ncbi:nuclear receptor-interacting protein 2 [Rhinoraja longicauda]
MSELRKDHVDVRDKASLQQRRRLKQATQFTHKDSADLLPLDGWKRMGMSRDLQPHNIVQRRLLESNITKLHDCPGEPGTITPSPLADERQPSGKKGTVTLLTVLCKCRDQTIKVTINTGCHQNTISASCLNRICLEDSPVTETEDCDRSSSTQSSKIKERVEKLEITLGNEKIQCSALVVGDEMCELSIGLQTLLSLKCVIDLERQVLSLGKSQTQLQFITDPGEQQANEEEEKE